MTTQAAPDADMKLYGYSTDQTDYPLGPIDHDEAKRLREEDEKANQPPPLTDPRYVKAKEYREAGTPVRRICHAVGISMSTYYAWFPKQPDAGLRESNIKICQDLNRLRKEGYSDTAIARLYKRRRQWVWSMIGPRSKPGPNKTVVVMWKTSVENQAKVEKIARHLGAALDDQRVSIGVLLDMIATGDLVVRAPRRAKIKASMDDQDSAFHGARSTRSSS